MVSGKKKKVDGGKRIGKLRLKADLVYAELEKQYPDAHCELEHKNAFELLIATILSAQCTDERVNMVTKVLFKRFPTVLDLAEADLGEVEKIIRSTGFFRAKARNIVAASKMIMEKFLGEVPHEMEKLIELPGVARKTANVVLSNVFGVNEGVVVDTHVKRISNRIGLVDTENVLRIESELMKLFGREKWGKLSHLLIWHGRKVCKAKKPACGKCVIREICEYPAKVV